MTVLQGLKVAPIQYKCPGMYWYVSATITDLTASSHSLLINTHCHLHVVVQFTCYTGIPFGRQVLTK